MNETSKQKAPARAAGLYPADILLPDFSAVSGTRWSVVACDQYTSQPDYWQRAEELVGDAPSTLRLILPEVWLDEASDRIPRIHAAMEDCLRRVLRNRPDSMVLVERRLHGGQLRRGLVGCIDLEEYDYSRGAQSLIRATEATVPERIPPRMTIREAIELVDRLKPNQYGSADKLRWLSELDGVVWHEIWSAHETAVPAFAGYGPEADLDGTALLIGWPYDEIYRWYLEMKIDDANGEMTKYNNSAAKYNTYYQAYQNAYNRAHMPKGEVAYFRL